jgi:hypothetical protein
VKPRLEDISADPFRERRRRTFRFVTDVLGARFEFESDSRELLEVARDAFAHVPQYRLTPAVRAPLRVSLRRVRHQRPAAWDKPPLPALSSGNGWLLNHLDAENFAIVDPPGKQALVQVTDSLLRHPRLLRYELIEFVAISLAARTQGLVPLHAGCVGADGRGVLLVGSSGSGKSTLTLHAALDGLEFLAEDSVFVQPGSLRATGLSAHVHARTDARNLIGDRRVRLAVANAPLIERRSGVRKHEIDLRSGLATLATKPLRIVSTVLLSARKPRNAKGLVPLTTAQLRRALRAEQPYAANQPGWSEFERRAVRAGGFILHRVPPAEGVAALRKLLGARPA